MFKAFFTERRDVSDVEVLADVANQIGLDADAGRNTLASGDRAEAVRRKEDEWVERGISGVPAMIFDGKYLSTGALGVANYGKLLRRVEHGHLHSWGEDS